MKKYILDPGPLHCVVTFDTEEEALDSLCSATSEWKTLYRLNSGALERLSNKEWVQLSVLDVPIKVGQAIT